MLGNNNDHNNNNGNDYDNDNKKKFGGADNPPALPPVTVIIIAVSAAGLASLSANISLGIAMIFIQMSATILAGILFTLFRKPMLFVMPILTFLTAVFFGADPFSALAALVYFPTAAVISSAVLSRRSRVSVICRASVTVCCAIALLYLINLLYVNGYVNGELLRGQIDYLYSSLKDAVLSLNDIQGYQLFEEPISPETAASAASAMLVIIPSLLVCAVNIFCFAICTLLTALLKLFGTTSLTEPEQTAFLMSPVSAGLYIAAYLANVFSSQSLTISPAHAVAYNIYLVLTPGFLFAGFTYILRNRKRPPFNNIIFIGISVAVLLWLPSLFMNGLAAAGVISSLHRLLKQRRV